MSQLMKRTKNEPIVTLVSEMVKVPVVIWNNLIDCSDDCPIHEKCAVKKEGKCSLMQDYFSNILNSAIAVHGSHLNQKDMVSIGMLLMPIYSQLFKFKLMEMNIRNSEMIRYNKQGTWSMHPVYREIRECVKQIDLMWNRIGMKNFSSSKDGADIFNGDDDYYSQIAAAEAE